MESEGVSPVAVDQAANSDSGEPGEKAPAPDELLASYTQAGDLLEEKAREVDDLRSRIETMDADTKALLRRAEEDAFAREFQEAYKNDPATATAGLFQRAQADALALMETRLHQALDDQRVVGRYMSAFVEDPSRANLKPYQDQLEFLVMDRGFSPQEAAEFIVSIDGRRDRTSRQRSAAAREIRNRAAVESGGEVGEPAHKDREFDKVLKKAKTLDEMFAGLSKLKL